MKSKPLAFEEYSQYQIDPRENAFTFSFDCESVLRANEIEEEFLDNGYQIVRIEIEQNSQGKVQLFFVAFLSKGFTF